MCTWYLLILSFFFFSWYFFGNDFSPPSSRFGTGFAVSTCSVTRNLRSKNEVKERKQTKFSSPSFRSLPFQTRSPREAERPPCWQLSLCQRKQESQRELWGEKIINANTKFPKWNTSLTMSNINKPMPQSAPARRRLTCPAGLRPVARVCSLAVANGLHALHWTGPGRYRLLLWCDSNKRSEDFLTWDWQSWSPTEASLTSQDCCETLRPAHEAASCYQQLLHSLHHLTL